MDAAFLSAYRLGRRRSRPSGWRSALRVSASHGPAAISPQPPRAASSAPSRRRCARQQAHGLAKGEALSRRGALSLRNAPVPFAGVPGRAPPIGPAPARAHRRFGRISLISASRQRFAVERDLHMEIQQRVRLQRGRLCRQPCADSWTRRAVHAPARGHAHHHASAFQCGDVFQELQGFRRRPAQGIVNFACRRPSPSAMGKMRRRFAPGSEAKKAVPCSPAPAYSRSACPRGRC